MKKRLAIINSDPVSCSYGGVAPIMRNMHDTLSEVFDLDYLYIPESWKKIHVPCRLLIMVYLAINLRRIRRSDFILSHIPEGSYVASFTGRPYAHIYHGNANPMEGSRYGFGKYFKWVFELFFRRIEKTASLRYTVGPVWDGVKKLYNPIVQTVSPVSVSDRAGFIFCGRLESLKNIDRLIDVYSALPADIKEGNVFYIAGSGTQESRLKEYVRSKGLHGQVVFLGSVDNDRILELDSTKRILMMASSHEGFPTAIAEALSVGVPVVTTDVGDIPLVVKDGFNGRVLPADFGVGDYVAAIKDILDDYDRYSDNAYVSSSIFDNERITKSLADDIMSLIEA